MVLHRNFVPIKFLVMKYNRLFPVLAMLLGLSLSSSAQVRKIPPAVTDSFHHRYPDADKVEFHDQLTGYNIRFVLDSVPMIAKFNNKGEWHETERSWSYDSLSAEVKDGFQKSKYAAEWKVKETAILMHPDGTHQYRIKIEKNDLQKKYLYFNPTGRMIKDGMTL
jgi:hypothetical protein